jgi:hypothetical protein
MENIKLTTEELEKFKLFQQKNSLVVSELGSIELTKLQIERRRSEALNFLTTLREEEDAFSKELFEKYGDGSINFAEGEFIPLSEPEGE